MLVETECAGRLAASSGEAPSNRATADLPVLAPVLTRRAFPSRCSGRPPHEVPFPQTVRGVPVGLKPPTPHVGSRAPWAVKRAIIIGPMPPLLGFVKPPITIRPSGSTLIADATAPSSNRVSDAVPPVPNPVSIAPLGRSRVTFMLP